MAVYHFVGSYCEIDAGRIKLDKFGQRIELDDKLAEIVIKGGGAILPEDKFKAISFTDEELKDFAYPGARENAPESFKARVKAAHIAFCDHKQALEATEEVSE